MKIILILSIEGHPFIIRFKTSMELPFGSALMVSGIEGHPFIIRFKTQ